MATQATRFYKTGKFDITLPYPQVYAARQLPARIPHKSLQGWVQYFYTSANPEWFYTLGWQGIDLDDMTLIDSVWKELMHNDLTEGSPDYHYPLRTVNAVLPDRTLSTVTADPGNMALQYTALPGGYGAALFDVTMFLRSY